MCVCVFVKECKVYVRVHMYTNTEAQEQEQLAGKCVQKASPPIKH